MEMEPEMQAALVKVGVFVLVQALVYLILSQSSTVFSRTKSLGGLRRPARSPSLGARRMIALLSDLPLAAGAGEPCSPVAAFARTWSASSSPMLAATPHRKQD